MSRRRSSNTYKKAPVTPELVAKGGISVPVTGQMADAENSEVPSQESSSVELGTIAKAGTSLAFQMDLDPDGSIFTAERYDGYARMAEKAEEKRDALFRTLVILDAIIVLLSLGQSITVPGFEVSLDKIPGAVEIVTILGGFCFYFAVMALYDEQIYSNLISQFDLKKVQYSGIDPELLTVSQKFTNLHLKFSRKKQNHWGNDFLFPGVGAKRFFAFQLFATVFMILTLPLLHIAAMTLGLLASAPHLGWGIFPFATLVILTNLIGTLLAIGHNISWRYTLAPHLPRRRQSPLENPAHQPSFNE
jgi:hypothetical protein